MQWQFVAYLGLAVAVGGCGDDRYQPPSDIVEASAAHVPVTIEVPDGMNDAPLDVERTLLVPEGFAGIRVVGRVENARFLAETPEGDLLVSNPGDAKADGPTGFITRIHDGVATQIAGPLDRCHDMVFAKIDGVQYLYISVTTGVLRTVWHPGASSLDGLEQIIDGLPGDSTPELHGHYGHGLKNIAINEDTLYVSIASMTNSDPVDQLSDPVRGAIYAYNLDGSGGRLFAKGIRNAEGLAFHPKTGELWAAVNHRDNVRYPYHDNVFPYGGDANPGYYTYNPPEPFTAIHDGDNLGWPYCNPTARSHDDPFQYTEYTNMPYVQDIDNNEDESVIDCAVLPKIGKGLPAHSAPLGMSFWTGEFAPTGYAGGALIGEHGCWNCGTPHGYQVVFLKAHDSDDGFDDQMPFVTGFWPIEDDMADPHDADLAWGRPVDVIPNRRGNLYISDDRSGAVYELYR